MYSVREPIGHEAGDLTYRAAGVDIEAGEEAVRLIKKDVESTYIPGVVGSLGGFAGLYELPKGLEDPVLVTATDGVGTKLLLAQETGRLDTVGIDLVAMSVNDVLTIGARPILFLDYVAVGRLTPGGDGPDRGRGGRGLPPGRVCPGGRGDGGDARALRPGRVRSGRLLRGPGGEAEAHRRVDGLRGRRRHRPGVRAASTPTASRWCARCSR